MIISKLNLPKSSYNFEKNLMEENKISPSMVSVFVAIINDGKCRNERCEKFNKKLDDHEIEICYFIPLKDHFQRIVLLWSVLLWLFFPYTIQEPPWGTCEQTLWHAQTPERTGKPLFGNKAFSPLLCVVGVPTKVLLDYMHLILARMTFGLIIKATMDSSPSPRMRLMWHC